MRLTATTLALALLASTASAEEAKIKIVPAKDAVWNDVGGMPKGVRATLLFGDPKVGPYLVILKIPAGTTLAPHSHSAEEVTTVLSGTLIFGAGEKVDESKGTELTPGAYVDVPVKMNHWAKAKTDVLTVRFANGPGDVIYVDAKDDPRAKK